MHLKEIKLKKQIIWINQKRKQRQKNKIIIKNSQLENKNIQPHMHKNIDETAGCYLFSVSSCLNHDDV